MILFYFRMSSTSVEQARERNYHRALLLSKDKDTGDTQFRKWPHLLSCLKLIENR